MSDVRKIEGLTTEGHHYWMTVTYAPGAPEGADPVELMGSYGSTDGGGSFRIERRSDGLYYDADDEDGEYAIGHKNPREMLPWVISESRW
jgi:hypothetical protein